MTLLCERNASAEADELLSESQFIQVLRIEGSLNRGLGR